MADLIHKGYTGSIIASVEDDCLHGKILFIEDIISYEGETIAELKNAFIAAVDRYIAYCLARKQEPQKPFSGTFNVRPGSEIHRDLAIAARKEGVSLNEYAKLCFKNQLTRDAESSAPPAFRWAGRTFNAPAQGQSTGTSGMANTKKTAEEIYQPYVNSLIQ